MKKNRKIHVHEHKETVHFVSSDLLMATNPVTVNLIGVGGTGSSMLTALVRLNISLIALGHPGIHVTAYDSDIVEEPNLGRQLFNTAELGLNKAVALINKANRGFGLDWKAIAQDFKDGSGPSTITISCVDSVASRLELGKYLWNRRNSFLHFGSPRYWLDCGNDQKTGQALLSTVGELSQPTSKKYNVQGSLPMITAEYGSLLQTSELQSNTPSCSLAEALDQQDLFINTNIANNAASLIWTMFREGFIKNRGFFLNLEDFRMQPIKINSKEES